MSQSGSQNVPKTKTSDKVENSRDESPGNEEAICPDCNKQCTENDQAVECEFCERWFHKKCQKVSDSLYQAISDDNESGTNMVHWYCNTSCNLFAKKFMNNMFELRRGLDKVTDRVEHISRKVENLECGAMPEKLEKSVRNIVRDELKSEEVEETLEKLESVKELIDKQGMQTLDDNSKHLESISKFMDDKAREQELEIEDRKRRQSNLIVFKLPESNAEELKDKFQDDQDRVNEILEEIGADSKPVYMKRLISKTERDRRAKPTKKIEGASKSVENEEVLAAPLLMKFKNQMDRDEVLEKYIGAVKDAKDDNFEGEEDRLYLKLNIQRDMTVKEREEDLKLYNELKEKKAMSKNLKDERARWVRREGRIINIGRYPRGRMEQRDANRQ